MKDILRNPLFLAIIIGIAIIYIMIIYTLAARDKKLVIFLEKLFIGIFLFTISGSVGVTIMPFKKLHPAVWFNRETTPPTLIGQALIYGIFIFILIPRLRNGLKTYPSSLIAVIIGDPFIFLLLLIVSLSCFWSQTPDTTLKAILAFLGTTAIAVYMGQQYKWQELFAFWRWVHFFILLYSLAMPNKLPHLNNAWGGILAHKNTFTFFMAITAVLWCLNAFYSPKQRRMSIVIFFLSLIAVQGGASGAGKVLVILLFSCWISMSFIKKLPFQWAFVSVVLFMVVSICITIVVADNAESIIVDGLGKDMTLTGRTLFWPQVIDRINLRPFFGYGFVGFWQPWRGAENPASGIIVMESQFVPPHAHNGLLDMALDIGWVGAGLFILSLFNNIAKGVVYLNRAKLPEAALPIILITYIIMTNFTETGMLAIGSNWWWYIVMTVRLSLDTTGRN